MNIMQVPETKPYRKWWYVCLVCVCVVGLVGGGGGVAGRPYLSTLLLNLEAHSAHELLLARNVTLGPLHGLALSNLLLSCMLHEEPHHLSMHSAAQAAARLQRWTETLLLC